MDALNDILAAFPRGPRTTKDNGALASRTARRTYAEYALRQEAVYAGLVPPIDPAKVATIRGEARKQDIAWIACRTGLNPEKVKAVLKCARGAFWRAPHLRALAPGGDPGMTTTSGDTVEAPFSGAIFDVDGVLVDTPHERAWREALQELMEGPWTDIRARTTWSRDAFTPQVYQEVMSGKPRESGALAALDHFEVPDPQDRVEAYAEHKQTMVVELIEAGEFTAFPDALRFILAVKAAGLLLAAASSSKNAGLFLKQIRLDTFAQEQALEYEFLEPGDNLLELFDADVSGRDFEQGKPHPEMFLTAAEELGLTPQGCFVIEDAVSGVQAAKAAGMSALGLARADDYELLAEARADIVVTSLEDIDLDALARGRLAVRAG